MSSTLDALATARDLDAATDELVNPVARLVWTRLFDRGIADAAG